MENNMTQNFISTQGQRFADAITDGYLAQATEFMITFLDLPRTFKDGENIEYPTGFDQAYNWTQAAGYLFQTRGILDGGTVVHEMSIYKKEVSKYTKIVATFDTRCEECEAPVKRARVEDLEALKENA